MKLELTFKNIRNCNGVPLLRICINRTQVWEGSAQEQICIEHPVDQQSIDLEIEHYGKNNNTDVVANNGIIVQDKSCELDSISVDGQDLAELKWLGCYVTEDQESLDKCLFFGKNGHWHLSLELPALRWMLKTRHAINNNDPYWEEDYNNYIQACKLVNNLN